MCFGAVGDAIGDAFSSVDKFANSINPFKGITDWTTDNTIGKIPGIGKPLDHLADWGDSHPAEVGALIAGGWGAAELGIGEAAGAAGGASGATAEGTAAGTLGAADSAAASTDLGLTAADVGGTSGAVAGSGAETAAGVGTGAKALSLAATTAKVVGPAVVSTLLQPKPPKTKAPTAMPDPLAQQEAQRQKIITQLASRGRTSTILTNPANTGGSLGG